MNSASNSNALGCIKRPNRTKNDRVTISFFLAGIYNDCRAGEMERLRKWRDWGKWRYWEKWSDWGNGEIREYYGNIVEIAREKIEIHLGD